MCRPIQNSKNAFVWVDPRQVLINNCNKAAEILLESNKEQIVSHHHSTIFPSHKAGYYADMFIKLTQENELLTKKQSYIKFGNDPVRPDDCFINYCRGEQIVQEIFYDIDDSKKIVDKLQDSEERFRSIFEVSGIGMALVDPEGSS